LHHLTSKDGLGSEFIQSIFQDSKGFYWIGTSSGLQKFDGYRFAKAIKAGKDLLPMSTVTETKRRNDMDFKPGFLIQAQ
jgi:ligand-binding sensor domain-containing protein